MHVVRTPLWQQSHNSQWCDPRRVAESYLWQCASLCERPASSLWTVQYSSYMPALHDMHMTLTSSCISELEEPSTSIRIILLRVAMDNTSILTQHAEWDTGSNVSVVKLCKLANFQLSFLSPSSGSLVCELRRCWILTLLFWNKPSTRPSLLKLLIFVCSTDTNQSCCAHAHGITNYFILWLLQAGTRLTYYVHSLHQTHSIWACSCILAFGHPQWSPGSQPTTTHPDLDQKWRPCKARGFSRSISAMQKQTAYQGLLKECLMFNC